MRAAFRLFNTTHAHAWRTLLRLIASHLRNCIVFAPTAFRRNGFIRESSETNFQRSEMFETLTLPCNFQLLEIESKLDALSQTPLLLEFINRADRQLKNRNETRTKQRNQSLSSALWKASLRSTNQLINRHDRKRGLFSLFLFAFFLFFFLFLPHKTDMNVVSWNMNSWHIRRRTFYDYTRMPQPHACVGDRSR